jgi:hypothetical protein
VAFLAFYRCCPLDDDGFYAPLDECPIPFAPKTGYETALLDSLCEVGLISLSEYSTPGIIYYHKSELMYDIERVHWSGDFEANNKLAKQIEECALKGNWPDGWDREMEAVWRKLAMAECREFFEWCRSKHDLPGEDEQPIITMLENILRDFSVGQCYRIIWQGREWAESLARNKGMDTFQMARSCQLWADQARAERYSVTAFKRQRPRSMISHVLFDVILKIGERGFTEPIGSECLPGSQKVSTVPAGRTKGARPSRNG